MRYLGLEYGRINFFVYVYVCVCVCACVRACVCVCVRELIVIRHELSCGIILVLFIPSLGFDPLYSCSVRVDQPHRLLVVLHGAEGQIGNQVHRHLSVG